MTDRVNEQHVGRPHPRLRPFVSEYVGYRQEGFVPGVHAGLPSRSLTCIVAFDERLDVTTDLGGPKRDTYWGMIGGLHATPALVRHGGRQHGVQLDVTPRGAKALFGLPAADLASRVVHLEEAVPSFAGELIDRLSSAGSWRSRWAVLDDVFLRVLQPEAGPGTELELAWSRLLASAGSIGIAELAAEIGWSRRHFSQRFRATYGLTPKVMARVLRFERAQRLMRLPTRPSLASVAHTCGYADQAHMSREWREFAGVSPAAWIGGESIPFVQDDPDPSVAS